MMSVRHQCTFQSNRKSHRQLHLLHGIYLNVFMTEYIEWFWPIAEHIHRILLPDGSFVMELGGAWNPGSGTRSLFTYELLLKLGTIFHLAQDLYWHNPSRLPQISIIMPVTSQPLARQWPWPRWVETILSSASSSSHTPTATASCPQ